MPEIIGRPYWTGSALGERINRLRHAALQTCPTLQADIDAYDALAAEADRLEHEFRPWLERAAERARNIRQGATV